MFWEFRASIPEVGKLADMVSEIVSELDLHKVEIELEYKMLCNFRLNLCFIIINLTGLGNSRPMDPCGVIPPFCLVVQSMLQSEGIHNLLLDLLSRNWLHKSSREINSFKLFSMCSMVSVEWSSYCAIMWHYTMFLTHYRASVMGIVSIAAEFKRVATNTEAITSPSTVMCLPLHFVNSLCGMFNWAKLGYEGITTKPWLNLAILDCCFMKAFTQSLKCLSIPR